ncbi:MAG: hypothetical protein WEB00_11480 [Dehalococcoidia bacterium]
MDERREPGVAEDHVEAAARAGAQSLMDTEPRPEKDAKPQPEAESIPVPTRDKPPVSDYPSGVQESVDKILSGKDLPERPESGASKPRVPQEIEDGPGDPTGPQGKPA